MTGNAYFDKLGGLNWSQALGMGYIETVGSPYDAAYFEKYVGYEASEMGQKINHARLDLVRDWFPDGSVVDVGVGSGQFARALDCYGFDINHTAINMLNDERRFFSPYIGKVDCATFWDSLEHIKDIGGILENVTKFVFVSLPIFDDVSHVIRSKHYRPDEHCWYFTDLGFKMFMKSHGFEVVAQNTMESDLGREGIGTYACKRES